MRMAKAADKGADALQGQSEMFPALVPAGAPPAPDSAAVAVRDASANLSVAFDYGQMSDALAKEARQLAGDAQAAHSRMTAEVLALGARLNAIKGRLDHGLFMKWVAVEFPMGHRTATNYMNAAERFGDKVAIVSNLPPATVYQLAAPATPEPVREAVVKRLQAGERLAPEAIRQEVATAREEAKEARRLEAMPDKRAKEAARKKRIAQERERHAAEERRLEAEAEAEAAEIFARIQALAGERFADLFGFIVNSRNWRTRAKVEIAISRSLKGGTGNSSQVDPTLTTPDV